MRICIFRYRYFKCKHGANVKMANENLETIKGTVKTITFHNKDNGWVVAKIIPEKGWGIVAVTGKAKYISVGSTVIAKGKWVIDPKHGRSLLRKHRRTFYS
ncbi:hypothetical protein ES708_17923 [subsurface metagenome]